MSSPWLERLALDGPLVPLGGGRTNRNWRARRAGRDVVVRACDAGAGVLGIDRGAEREAGRRAAAGGYGPAVVAELPEHGVLVTEWVGGGELSPEQVRRDPALGEVAAALRAFHVGPELGCTFAVVPLAQRHLRMAREGGVAVPGSADAALALARRIVATLAGVREHAPVPCHNDLLSGNLLLGDDGRVRVVDWEYAGMNDPFFDLANLAVNNHFAEDDDRALLAAYFGEPCTPRRFAALRLMRLVSDLREGTWGLVQSVRSPLDEDYLGYARRHLDRLAAAARDPRVEGWLAQAAR